MKWPRSSPSRISGMTSSARTRIEASADTDALRIGCSGGCGRFVEDEVLGGVVIDGQRAADFGVSRPGGLGGGSVGEPAPWSEREIDGLGRSKAECVCARVVAVGGEDDVRGRGRLGQRLE